MLLRHLVRLPLEVGLLALQRALLLLELPLLLLERVLLPVELVRLFRQLLLLALPLGLLLFELLLQLLGLFLLALEAVARLRWGTELRRDEQWPVVADAEAGRHQVVGLALGGRLRRGTDVLLTEVEREKRDDERYQDRRRAGDREPRDASSPGATTTPKSHGRAPSASDGGTPASAATRAAPRQSRGPPAGA